MPLTFEKDADYDGIDQMDELRLPEIRKAIAEGGEIVVENLTKGTKFPVRCELSKRQREMLLAGGLLNYTKLQAE